MLSRNIWQPTFGASQMFALTQGGRELVLQRSRAKCQAEFLELCDHV